MQFNFKNGLYSIAKILTFIFIALKLLDVISQSWFVVTILIWLPALIIVVCDILECFVDIIIAWKNRKQ